MRDVAAVVAAAATNRGIGCNGKLPWRLRGDMSHFKRLTETPPSQRLKNAVIMGRKTWDSIPTRSRPLPNRINVVLTCNPNFYGDCITANSLDNALAQLDQTENVGQIFVIGGGEVYKEAMEKLVNRVYFTEVKGLSTDVVDDMDTFFPDMPEADWETEIVGEWNLDERSGIEFRFTEVSRVQGARFGFGNKNERDSFCRKDIFEEYHNSEEIQYLDLCRDILDNGVWRGDRTGTGTLSKFATQMRFSLRDNTNPLLTTKRTFWRGVAEELLWFISGSTNANKLAEKDIHIWDGNGSREFLDQRGLHHREVGDLGPVYGFQWRHFGAKYSDMHADYTGKGVDQLLDCIDKIKNNPDDRRIIMSAWNPTDLNIMALPPCHMFCQFYVDTSKNELSCQMYQRSADMGLGVPFNIASYALLTHLIAHVTGRKPGDFIHTIGDAHVYLNHITALEEQLTRKPREFPKLFIKTPTCDIDDITYDDLILSGYNPHRSISMKMAV